MDAFENFVKALADHKEYMFMIDRGSPEIRQLSSLQSLIEKENPYLLRIVQAAGRDVPRVRVPAKLITAYSYDNFSAPAKAVEPPGDVPENCAMALTQ